MSTTTSRRVPAPPRRQAKRRSPYISSIGLKLMMALTGAFFVLFVIAHMYGNLKAFAGHDAYNEYAEHLRTVGQPFLPREVALWLLRAGLIASVVVHIACALVLWRRARRARTTKYAARPIVRASLASRTMRPGGLGLLLFLVWHLANFTIGKVNVRGGATNDPYLLVVDTFSVWWSTLLYLAAMVLLGLHLWHGTWSAAQTLGWTGSATRRRAARVVAAIVAVTVAGGFSLSPMFILFGVVGP